MDRFESVCLMNICVVQNESGEVLALDKVSGSYIGTTFPGGHIERCEVFNEAVIREVFEETNLVIESPVLLGVYHWYAGDVHNIIFVYFADRFSGDLVSSREGRVYWISLEELKKKKLATGSEHIITMVENRGINECVMRKVDDGYFGSLY